MKCLFVADSTAAADPQSITVVALVWHNELDSTVAMLVVVPIENLRQPLACLDFADKTPARVIKSIFSGAQERF